MKLVVVAWPGIGHPAIDAPRELSAAATDGRGVGAAPADVHAPTATAAPIATAATDAGHGEKERNDMAGTA